MMRRGVLGMVALGLLTPSLVGCAHRETRRYRMTVEVQTPQGIKTGSAVREVEAVEPPNIPMLGENRGGVGVKGEAIVVDLPNGQTLFALLTGRDGYVDYAARIPDLADMWGWGKHAVPTREGPVELYPTHPKTPRLSVSDPLPLLVRFRDVRDPKSVEKVDPANLAASFGPGIALKAITIQITSDPVTTGIEKRLGWLGKYPEPSLKPGHDSRDFSLAATLHHGDFRQGDFK